MHICYLLLLTFSVGTEVTSLGTSLLTNLCMQASMVYAHSKEVGETLEDPGCYQGKKY